MGRRIYEQLLPHLHERESEQVISWPDAGVPCTRIVRPESNSPDAILRTGLDQNGRVCSQQIVPEARRLSELEQIALYHDLKPRGDPILKSKSRNVAPDLLHPKRMRLFENLPSDAMITEQERFAMHHPMLCGLVLNTFVHECRRIPLAEALRAKFWP
jgi:hypothetical protein